MVFKSFRAGIALRIAVLLFTCYLIGWIGFNSRYIHTIVVLYIAVIVEAAWIIHYLDRTNRMLDRFFVSIFESGSFRFDNLPGSESFSRLTEKMEKLSQMIHVFRIQKEREYHYLKYVVEHLNTGILSLISDGKIDLVNQTGLKILGLTHAADVDDLKVLGREFYETIHSIRLGEQRITRAIVDNELVELSVRASEFKLFDREIKLLSFHDIHKELDQKELDAWQKVTRVMAHEILSTVSPIRSLSEHLSQLLNKNGQNPMAVYDDVRQGLEIINQRSEGLMQYVNSYRQLSDTPEPIPEKVGVISLTRGIVTLCKAEFGFEPEVELGHDPDKIKIMADERLTVQAALNILRNCMQAVETVKTPKITITVRQIGNKVRIQFTDNGTGIDPEDIENVFIPFFTTKQNGSGIWLTISRQLINIQGGQLDIQSRKGKGTTVTITFDQSK